MSLTADLRTMLDAVSSDLTNGTKVLAAADAAQDAGEPQLEWFLRNLPTGAKLFTGSRCYGIPRPDSDWDWVLYSTPTEITELAAFATQATRPTPVAKYADTDMHTALRFGPLNVICVTEERQWQAWWKGTDQLIKLKPVHRSVAVFHFDLAFDRGLDFALASAKADHPPTAECPDPECLICGYRDCPLPPRRVPPHAGELCRV